jgi:hypothetical protein
LGKFGCWRLRSPWRNRFFTLRLCGRNDKKNKMIDKAKNGSLSELSAGVATGATSCTLIPGAGEKFLDPETDGEYNAFIWNSTDYANPVDDPFYEIVRITDKIDDTFEIVRAQEDTSDVDHNIEGKTYKICAGMTAKIINDIRGALPMPPETGIISGTTITVTENIGSVLGLYINGQFIHPNVIDWSFADKVITISAAMAAGFDGQTYTVIYTKL